MMKKIFNVIMAFAAAALLFSSCEAVGVGTPFPKQPRIEFEEAGYELIVSDATPGSFILRWMDEPTATYTVYLSSLDSEETLTLKGTSKLVENDVREMQVKQADLVNYALTLGYEVTGAGITSLDPEVEAPSTLSFRINVSAKDKNGEDFPQQGVYTRWAPVVLIPEVLDAM